MEISMGLKCTTLVLTMDVTKSFLMLHQPGIPNPGQMLGRHLCCHYTIGASLVLPLHKFVYIQSCKRVCLHRESNTGPQDDWHEHTYLYVWMSFSLALSQLSYKDRPANVTKMVFCGPGSSVLCCTLSTTHLVIKKNMYEHMDTLNNI